MTTLESPGKSTSIVEISHISSFGIWIYAHDKEYFLAYDHFPWFKEQKIGSILNIREVSPGHFYWPELDIDLNENIILHPENYPLGSMLTKE